MKTIPVTDVAFSGYRLLASKPAVAAIWVVFNFVVTLALTVFMAAAIGPKQAALQAMKEGGGADPATTAALAFETLPFNILEGLIGLVILAVAFGAASRAGLGGRDSRFGYLKFGKEEARLFLVLFVVYLVFVVLLIVTAVLGMIGLMSWGPAALSALNDGVVPPGMVILRALLFGLPGFLFTIFLMVKLSLAPAQTVAEGGVRIFNSWRLTRGNFWRLFGAYCLAAIPTVVAVIVVAAATTALSGESTQGGFMAGFNSAQPGTASVTDALSPRSLFNLAVAAVISTLYMAAFAVPAAAACKRLGKTEAVEDVFGEAEDQTGA